MSKFLILNIATGNLAPDTEDKKTQLISECVMMTISIGRWTHGAPNTYMQDITRNDALHIACAVCNIKCALLASVRGRRGRIVVSMHSCLDGKYHNSNHVPFSTIAMHKKWMAMGLRQALLLVSQLDDGTQRFDEPVSNTTVNGCGGVPSPIPP